MSKKPKKKNVQKSKKKAGREKAIRPGEKLSFYHAQVMISI